MTIPSVGERAAGGRGGEPQPGRPRVAFLIHDLEPGGAERVFLTWVNRAESVDPVAIVVRPKLGLVAELAAGVPLRALVGGSRARPARDGPGGAPQRPPARGGPGAVRRTAGSAVAPIALAVKALRLRRTLRREGIRTVATFLHKSHAIAIAVKLLLDRDVRVVVNVHETPSDHIPRHFGPIGRVLMRLFTRFGIPRADLVVAVSDGVARDLVDGFGVPAERVTVVANPVDVDRIRDEGSRPSDHPFFVDGAGPVVIAVGRLVPLKGFDLLIDAFAALPRELGARLLLVGDGPERHALIRRTETRGVADRVSFIGFDPNPWRHMARADVLAMTSHTEALPNVLAEAAVLGLPVVATDCADGVREYVHDGVDGLLVPPSDVDAIRAALEKLLRDGTRRAAFREAALAGTSAWGVGPAVRRYEDALLGALQAPGRGD